MAERTNNRVLERIYAVGVWRSSTALHLGGEDDSLEHNVDMALLRDSEGRFYAPGSSIAGVARNYLASRVLRREEHKKGLDNEPHEIRALFGRPYASLLTFFDSPCISSDVAIIRDGAAIDPESGTADEGAKYNFEVLPAGSAFAFTILLIRYENLPLNVEHRKLLHYFRAVLDAFSAGEIRVGAKAQRGLGEGRVDTWSVHRLQMDNPEHVEAWLDQDWPRVRSVSVDDLSKESLKTDSRRQLTIDAYLAIKTSVLMRAPGAQPGAPDMVHHTEKGSPLMAGTGLAGAFLNRVERIANTMIPDARSFLPDLFRPRKTQIGINTDTGSNKTFRRSRIRVGEGPVSAGDLSVQGRNTIDRFTGGTLSGALFDEAPFWPDSSGQANWRFRLSFDLEDEPTPRGRYEAALILQAFKDLWLGDLPLGGEVGVGRGVMRGVHAEFRHPEKGQLILGVGPGEEGSIVVRRGDWKAWDELARLPTPKQPAQRVISG